MAHLLQLSPAGRSRYLERTPGRLSRDPSLDFRVRAKEGLERGRLSRDPLDFRAFLNLERYGGSVPESWNGLGRSCPRHLLHGSQARAQFRHLLRIIPGPTTQVTLGNLGITGAFLLWGSSEDGRSPLET